MIQNNFFLCFENIDFFRKIDHLPELLKIKKNVIIAKITPSYFPMF